MAFSRLCYSFREGDRSEYLAQFLLSAIRLCTTIPRQEDIGLDFLCSIADQEQDVLSFGYPFMVSVKSLSSPNIDLAVPEKRRAQKHVERLFRQDARLFFGVVDKNTVSLRLFSLLPLWFLFYEGGPVCGSISIRPRLDPTQTGDVGKPTRTPIPEWRGMFHFDERKYVFSCLRFLPDFMTIDPRLHRIVAAQPYPLLFATISGAHLYGFSSPDSDYDLRGAYVLPLGWLSMKM